MFSEALKGISNILQNLRLVQLSVEEIVGGPNDSPWYKVWVRNSSRRVKSDVLLLADVFESFRKTCLQYYKLDPCHYFTSPGLICDGMLKMTNIKLELMTNVDMFQFIKKGMHGGASYIANGHGMANNKCMKNHDKNAQSKYIMYLDAINLYG